MNDRLLNCFDFLIIKKKKKKRKKNPDYSKSSLKNKMLKSNSEANIAVSVQIKNNLFLTT